MATEFRQHTGEASGEDGQLILERSGERRVVTLLLDDTNWIIERCFAKRANKATRARVQCVGECRPFIVDAGQELYVFARLAPGGAGTQWDLSVTVCSDAA